MVGLKVQVIDGSLGEGGGQVLRTSVALSALTLKPVRIINIRAKRSNPGLRPQHVVAIKSVAQLCDAKVKGLDVGSREVTFIPSRHRGGVFKFDIGTAGSIPLVLQSLLIVAPALPEPCDITIRGGTDVQWSPPIDYIRFVLLPILRSIGVDVDIQVIRRGHYPKGGGLVRIKTRPANILKPLSVIKRGSVLKIEGISHAVRLPSHVAERQAYSALNLLKQGLPGVEIKIEKEFYSPSRDPHLGPGSGIVLWAITSNKTRLGADALGARGKPAEKVGREAAEKLLEELSTNMAFDKHMGDMLIPYLAMAKGTSSIGVSKLTMHALTNIMITEKLLNVKFDLTGEEGKPGVIRVKGIGGVFD
ncbi:MAG: RNA 3'-phosphate cyclase [Thermoprotei archaeon]|nr:MAG: RNA 3'-phosphate cyclase [Thermoprotei archaeon]